jgi:hypothetical protein
MVNMFPIGPFNNSVLNTYLHKIVFWAQIKKVAMDEILPLTGPDLLTGLQMSVFFPTYIDSCRMREWDYAFNVQIENKEVQKSFDWAKQVHGEGAAHRLIYR